MRAGVLLLAELTAPANYVASRTVTAKTIALDVLRLALELSRTSALSVNLGLVGVADWKPSPQHHTGDGQKPVTTADA